MKPSAFPEQNMTWAENQPPYIPLPVYSNERETISLWRLSFVERLRILFTGRLWLRQLNFGNPIQPQAPFVTSPFASCSKPQSSGRPSIVVKLRLEVQEFAAAMEERLAKHDIERGGLWRECAWRWLYMRLSDEVDELYDALLKSEKGTVSASVVVGEAADVANFAMFLAEEVRREQHPEGSEWLESWTSRVESWYVRLRDAQRANE